MKTFKNALIREPPAKRKITLKQIFNKIKIKKNKKTKK
mgnify:CR=1 FL=1|tara:strand:- start:650 stop:763 length:114 start_codon:yes stop_codon:yes gene_type:complete